MKLPVVLFTVLAISGCLGCKYNDSGPPGPPADTAMSNPVFSNATLIEVGIPKFGDTVVATPTFTWRVTGQKYVFIGVFTQNLVVTKNSIVNVNDNIWAWHSGLGTGREGNIPFSAGVDVVGGELLTGRSPTSLKSGIGYVWAVWAWGDDGTEIKQSSKEMFFVVK